MRAPTLKTERLVLRPPRLEDAPSIQEHFAHWEIIQHLSTGVPWPYPENGAQEFLEKRLEYEKQNEDLMWAITERGREEELIGFIDYMAEDSGGGNRGFWLGQPWHGRGYMTETVYAMQDHLFFDLGLKRIVVGNATDNPVSRRVKEKTGARYLETVPFVHRNGCTESEMWEVTRESWAKHRGRTR
jgi:ribosomal-protein-alanine N-acetyltransferase